MTEKESGTVKWFSFMKGYGFIESKGGKDIFAHISALSEGTKPEDLVEGTEVEFEIEKSLKGLQAKNIHKV